MNLGKFQQKLQEQFEESVKSEPPDLKVAMYHFMPIAKKIIEELERALDAKNDAEGIRGERGIPSPEFLDAVKRYKEYGIE